MNPPTYFPHARKSTDDDERQILSIESQLTELREFARKERLTIAQEFTESMSAKVPGRPDSRTHQSRFFAKACPDPDFRYRSKSIARLSSSKQRYITVFQGRYLEVCGEAPAL